MSKAQILEGLLDLSVEERLEVLEVGWESVTRERDAAPVSDELRTMLRERLAAYRADPADTLSWDEVKAGLTDRR